MKYYNLALWKAWFDKGYSFLSYPKYALFLMGLGDVISRDGDFTWIIIIGIAIGVLCFIFGFILYKVGYVEAEIEVSNKYNAFVKEMRKSEVLNTSTSNKKHGK